MFKPLLHTWSLSVEEQFYFVWPPLLLLVSRANDKRNARIVLVTAVGYKPGFRRLPQFASFPGDLLLDALARIRIHDRGRRDLAGDRREAAGPAVAGNHGGCGLAMIVVPFVAYADQTPFPFPGALLPCVGTALLIWAGGSCLTAKLWANRPMIWTGRISYSLYLVHWPLIIYYTYWRFAAPTELERIALVIGSFALAVPLNAFVENRFKRSRAPDRSSDPRFLGLVPQWRLVLSRPR